MLNLAVMGGADDPFVLSEFVAERRFGLSDARGRTQVSSFVTDRPNTKIIIVDGQSEHATSGGSTPYSPTNSGAHQLNVYDGAIYSGADPVLGASYNPELGPSSPVMRIADRIISQGKATRVIMVPIAIGNTYWAQYDPAIAGSLFSRFRCAYRRLAALDLAPDAIIAARGVTDGILGTTAASVKASIWAWADGVRSLGCTAPIFLGKFTLWGGTPNTTIQSAIDEAIDVGRDIRVGFDGDANLTVAGGHRLADGTHLTTAGLTAAGNGWADLIYP